jgi:HAE1 family hydrophobic/amphiphilic exporter-1
VKLPSASVRRPVFATMVTLIVVTIGLVSLQRLRIDLLPAVEMPTLTVSTSYEGASPEVMERLVTQILEEILATVPGVEEMTSTSSEGNSRVRVTFAWGTDIDAASTDVRATPRGRAQRAPRGRHPPHASQVRRQQLPGRHPRVSSPLDPVELTTVIEEQIRYRFARLPGVAQVDPWGGYDREVRVELDPARVNGR